MMISSIRKSVVTLAAVTLSFAGVANAQVSGKVSADGSSTVYPIAEKIAGDYRKEQPGVDVTVKRSGTGGGFKVFVKGETDLSNASRPIKKEEHDAAVAAGVEYIEVPVAYDGLSVVVNKGNTWAKQLTVDQLKKIFTEGGAKTWNEVDPSFPNTAIKIYSPGTDSGTFDYMKEIVTGGKKEIAVRKDMELSEDDNVLVRGVEGDVGAIGFFGSAYYFENKDQLNGVAIVNKAGQAVLPSPESIKDGSYNPLSRPLFVYVNKKSLSRPEVKSFVDFWLTNAGEAAAKVGYVALPDEIYERADANLKAGKTGTQFLKEDGKHKDGAIAEIYK